MGCWAAIARRVAAMQPLKKPAFQLFLVCEGFVGQAGTKSSGLGMPNLPLAKVPGHVDVQTDDELRASVMDVTVDPWSG